MPLSSFANRFSYQEYELHAPRNTFINLTKHGTRPAAKLRGRGKATGIDTCWGFLPTNKWILRLANDKQSSSLFKRYAEREHQWRVFHD